MISGKQKANTHDYYGGGGNTYSGDYYGSSSSKKWSGSNDWSGLKDLIVLAVGGLIIYAFYRTCLATDDRSDRAYR